MIIGGNRVDGRALQRSHAKIQGQPVQRFQAQRVCLQPFFIRIIFHLGIRAQIHFQSQLLKPQRLQKIIHRLRFLRLDVFRGKTRHRRASAVIEPEAVHAHEQPGVVVHFDDALNSPLVQLNVVSCWNGHEAIR